MKVMFIHPPMPAYGVCTPATYPPLGQALIASYLPPNVDVLLIDGLAHPYMCEESHLSREIGIFEPDVVGIRIMFINYLFAMEIAAAIKSIRKSILIVAGGPHASLLGAEILNDNPSVDIVLYG